MLADEKLKQIWRDYAAGLLTDAQAQAAAEAVEAGRARPAASSLPASDLPSSLSDSGFGRAILAR
jgi:hypothetical protein